MPNESDSVIFLQLWNFEEIASHESPTKTFCTAKNFAFGRKSGATILLDPTRSYPKRTYVDSKKMTCWGVKCIGESDSAGNCKFPKPSGATILLDPTRSFFLKTPLSKRFPIRHNLPHILKSVLECLGICQITACNAQ